MKLKHWGLPLTETTSAQRMKAAGAGLEGRSRKIAATPASAHLFNLERDLGETVNTATDCPKVTTR